MSTLHLPSFPTAAALALLVALLAPGASSTFTSSILSNTTAIFRNTSVSCPASASCIAADADTACGGITRQQFANVFANASASVVAANFAALKAACCAAGDLQVRGFAAAVFLGSVDRNTHGLTRQVAACAHCPNNSAAAVACDSAFDAACCWAPDAAPVAGQRYFGRGVMMLARPCNYRAVQRWMNDALGCANVGDLLSAPNLVADDLFYAYLSGVYVWLAPDAAGASCAKHAAAGRLAPCVRHLNARECTADGYAEQWHRLYAIQDAAARLGAPIDDTRLIQLRCTADVGVASHTTTLPPPTTSSSGANGGAGSSSSSDSTYESQQRSSSVDSAAAHVNAAAASAALLLLVLPLVM